MPDLEQGRSLLAMARKDLRAMEILVRALMARLAERGIELPEYSDALMDLTDFAVQYRYETLMAGEAIDRDATLDSVRRFVRLVMEAEPVTMGADPHI